jgi:uncharacterized membrane protein
MTADVLPRGGTRGRLGFAWFALTSLAIAVFAPLPYLTTSLSVLAGGGSQLAANYADRPGAIQAALYLHIAGGGLALLLSPLQFAARVRVRAPRLHRAVGRVVLAGILVGGAAGAVLSTTNVAGPVGTAGFGLLAVAWVGCALIALAAIRRRDIAAHRRWMVRAFALTYAAVTLRLWLGVMIGAQVSQGVAPDPAFDRAYAIVPFLCWVPNLVVAELYLRRRRVGRPGTGQRAASARAARAAR